MTFERGGVSITVNCLYPVRIPFGRHQNYGISEDGTARVYDRDTKEQLLEFSLTASNSEIQDIRQFFNDVVMLRRYPFNITPDGSHNIGNGNGGSISVRYWNSNFEELLTVYDTYRYSLIVRREKSDLNPYGDSEYADDMDSTGYDGEGWVDVQ